MTVRTRRVRRATTALAGLTAATLTLTACGNAAQPTANDGKLKVVASTNVWGSVAQAVGGDSVEVESIISDPSADPHSYESTPQDAAKVSNAGLVVFNGGGYDRFMDQILSTTGQGKPAVQAAEGEHEQPAAEPAPPPEQEGEHGHAVNEHVWYDLHAVREVADRVANELGRIKPDKAQAFRESAEKFGGGVQALEGRVDQIGAAHQGQKVIVTEPIAHYLIEQAKLEDITPESFVNAVEAENDPPAAAVAEVQNAVNSRQATALVYNPQTESPVTQGIRTLAQQNQIPVVEMTETLPQGGNYVQWMDGQISALENALNRKP